MYTYNFFNYFTKFVNNNNPVRIFNNWKNRKEFMWKMPIECIIKEWDFDLDVYIIAFNKPDLIKAQIDFLKTHLLDKYRLIIIDNSNIKSDELRQICISNDISYVKLPKNKLEHSHSHWAALNYIMKNFVLKQKTKYFWLLDHDCFLVKNLSVVDMLNKQPFWWLLIDNIEVKILWKSLNFAGNRWFMWPWCSFFRKDVFDKGYNFSPVKKWFPISFLDTWWGNRKYVYKYYNKSELSLLSRKNFQWITIKYGENIGNLFYHMWWAGHWNNDKIESIIIELNNSSIY